MLSRMCGLAKELRRTLEAVTKQADAAWQRLCIISERHR